MRNTSGQKTGTTRRLTLPLVLQEGSSPRVASSFLYVVTALVAAFVVWAAITPLRELARAPGQIKPSGSVKLVQHLEGGLVEEVLVSEGEIVEKGAPLVRLQPIAATSDLEQLLVRRVNLSLQRERLAALMEDRVPDWGLDGERYPHLVRDQLAALRAIRAQQERERAGLETQIAEKEAELRSLARQKTNLAAQLTIQKEQVAIREDLLKKGLMSKTVHLESRRQFEKTVNELESIDGQYNATVEALETARIKLSKADTDHHRKLAEERSRVSAELAEIENLIRKNRDRVRRLVVRAPIRGIVQEIVPKAVGEVVKPAAVVAQLVPVDSELVAEVQLSPQDVGHVKVGDPAEVKVSTYDAARLGGIDGTVRTISASTFRDDEGRPYYKAVIALARNYVGDDGASHMILPGMVVEADIITGARSLFRYLLKPVYRSLDTAFSER